MKKYIILKYDITSVFFPKLRNDNIYSFYKPNINQLILKIFSKLNLNFLFFGKWKKILKDIDVVILFDTGYKSNISKYIQRKNKNCKIIFYNWNLINEDTKFILHDINISEIWTFDKNDASKYNLKWNPQFFTHEVKLELKDLKYDILFLGRDKGREVLIENYNKIFQQKKLKTKLCIIKNEKNYIPYNEYLQLLSESKCILDILSPNQSGFTLRVMEALFLKKKLITNNKEIKNYDFYNKNNIFILEEDNTENIIDFIKSDYKTISKEIIDLYDFENWLKRFFESK